MKHISYEEALKQILDDDPRYTEDAYHFLQEALGFTMERLQKPDRGPARHITGRELLEGIREYTLLEFGPMSLTVLNTFGIHRTSDFGEIVFNLVDKGVLGKNEDDRREDFADGYDFEEAFRRPFLPEVKQPVRPRRKTPA